MRPSFSALSNILLLFQARATLSVSAAPAPAPAVSHFFQTQPYGTSNDTMPAKDVLIIGGGPGGLAVATGLARQLYTAVVFDSGVYRNARSRAMHNVPTWDHRNPAEFRAKARADLLARYDTVQFADLAVQSVRRTDAGRFEATDAQGTVWTGRKLVLASGVTDIFPDIPGYEPAWGRGM